MHEPQSKFMNLAIEAAKKNFQKSAGGPFGACIIRNNEVISVAANSVLISDATAHAEMNAIREASKKLQTHILSDCIIYSTTEPCPMCFSAIHWAQIPLLVFGSRIEDAAAVGFNELSISNQQVKTLGNSTVEIIAGFQSEECLSVLRDWHVEKADLLY